jgi:hypothetical protein
VWEDLVSCQLVNAKKRTKKATDGPFVTWVVEEVELFIFDQSVSPRIKNVTRIEYVGHDGGDAWLLLEAFTQALQFIHVVGPDCVGYDVWDVNKAPVEQSVRSVLSKNQVGHYSHVGVGFQVKV